MKSIKKLFVIGHKKNRNISEKRCYSDSVLYTNDKTLSVQSFTTKEIEFKEAMLNKTLKDLFENHCDEKNIRNYFDMYQDLLRFTVTEEEVKRKSIFWRMYEDYLHLKAKKPVRLNFDQGRVATVLRFCMSEEEEVVAQCDLMFLEKPLVQKLGNHYATFKQTKRYIEVDEDVKCSTPLAVEAVLGKSKMPPQLETKSRKRKASSDFDVPSPFDVNASDMVISPTKKLRSVF
jgi:hypothetical protein